jgi:exosortase H (IPTLxxWG-CTERM-specific)
MRHPKSKHFQRFALRFIALMVCFSALVRADAVVHCERGADALNRGAAWIAASVLRAFGETIALNGNVILFERREFEIVADCTGVEVISLFIAAVLAFPTTCRRRIKGLAIGIPVLVAVNQVRIVTLMYLGSRKREFFEYAHLYGWPALVLVLTIVLWVQWARIIDGGRVEV